MDVGLPNKFGYEFNRKNNFDLKKISMSIEAIMGDFRARFNQIMSSIRLEISASLTFRSRITDSALKINETKLEV